MAMKRLSLLSALLLLPVLARADASGTWMATFETQIGEQNYTYVFRVDGDRLTGTAKSSVTDTPSEIVDGRIDGNEITFVENLNYQGTELVITYKGTMTTDDEIQFMRAVGEFGTEELTAKRAK
jgi:hypothetical protein